MHKKTVLRAIILALIIIWTLLIFKLSNQSGGESSNLSQKVASLFVVDEETIKMIEPYIRKLAHLSEYTIGGMLFLFFFLTYSFSECKKMLFSLLIGIEYASLDEIHQLFIEGRAGKITDVLIDTIGISIGICLAMLLYKIVSKILNTRKDGVFNKQE